MAELISVIVTTYNREDALDAVLRSLSRQTDGAFEIVVAGDGSRPETARLVEAWAELHQDELLADWDLLHSGHAAAPIEPLK